MNCAKTESADCHCVANESEHFGCDQLGIGEIADRDVLRAKVEIFGTAEEGVAVLGAVLWLEAVELDLVAFYEVSDLHPLSAVLVLYSVVTWVRIYLQRGKAVFTSTNLKL